MTPLPCPTLQHNQTLLRLIEPNVPDDIDAQLRELLSTCFTKDQDTVFRTQRFWQERPARHYVVREASGSLIAHANYHDKRLGTESGEIRVGGVGDVCVHPDARGQGLVRSLLVALHQDLKDQGIPFGMLFGNPKVYGSSGYQSVTNGLRYREFGSSNWVTQVSAEAMVKVLGEASWPQGILDLRGPLF